MNRNLNEVSMKQTVLDIPEKLSLEEFINRDEFLSIGITTTTAKESRFSNLDYLNSEDIYIVRKFYSKLNFSILIINDFKEKSKIK